MLPDSISCRLIAACFVIFSLATGGGETDNEGVNLLPNGGFETDADGDGVGDGWIARPSNFSRQTEDEVREYIRTFPSHDELLQGETVRAADGWVLIRRDPGGPWPQEWKMLSRGEHIEDASYCDRLRREDLWQESRFSVLPVPEELGLGSTTLVLNGIPPHEPVKSKPIPVKPNSGYRLSWWYKNSREPQYVWLSVLDANTGREICALNMRARKLVVVEFDWIHLELPFRTGPDQTAIQIVPGLFFHFLRGYPWADGGDPGYEPDPDRAHIGGARHWYDGFRLVEDNSVVTGDAGDRVNPEPEWPEEALARGFVVVPRPTLPLTNHKYMPEASELGKPLKLALAPGETGSAVIFVRSLRERLTLTANPPNYNTPLISDRGHAITNVHGAGSMWVRAVEDRKLDLEGQRYLLLPTYLRHSQELIIEAGDGGQFWFTVAVPPGTPPGEYRGEFSITGGAAEARLPVALTVRDILLLEPDVAFGTWHYPRDWSGKMGPLYAVPDLENIYLADQRRHGMNTVAGWCFAERKDRDGKVYVTYSEIEQMVQAVKRAGLCREHPLLMLTWGVGGSFGEFARRGETIMDIHTRARESGWPELIFCVLDEPVSMGIDHRLPGIMEYYTPLRKKHGVRTATADLPQGFRVTGKYYDLWIANGSGYEQIDGQKTVRDLAAERQAELWMYNCGMPGKSPLWDRYYAGLWTWRTGVRGNMSWCYGWYVRITETGFPEGRLAWEGRLAGVNDYRYLHTLERAITSAGERGADGNTSVTAAQSFLDNLRRRIPLEKRDPGRRRYGGDMSFIENPLPEIAPEEYDRIREQCAQHINAIVRLSENDQ